MTIHHTLLSQGDGEDITVSFTIQENTEIRSVDSGPAPIPFEGIVVGGVIQWK
jgi:hypothetical protein